MRNIKAFILYLKDFNYLYCDFFRKSNDSKLVLTKTKKNLINKKIKSVDTILKQE